MAAASYRGLHYLLEKILLVPPMVVGEVNLKNSSDTTHILLKQFQMELLQFLYFSFELVERNLGLRHTSPSKKN